MRVQSGPGRPGPEPRAGSGSGRCAIKSSVIEGEHLSPREVRSSIARKLGLDIGGLPEPGGKVEGALPGAGCHTRRLRDGSLQPLVYDFYGFPERYYQTRYPAPGAPDLAARVRDLLQQGDIASKDEPDRGLDHGAYVRLVAMYPNADVPVLQVSMPALDPKALFALGRALAPLREDGVLVFGSGFLTHNMRYAFRPGIPAWARELARALVRLAPEQLALSEIGFGDLPLYSYDYDADFPPAARAFKDAIASADAVLFVTPEYNRSIPGGLKNAIDWASRPYGQNAFTRKPSAIIGTSPGKIGTAIAQTHLRSILAFCNSPLMNSIEAYLQFEPGLITDDGTVTNEGTETSLRKFMAEFAGFVARVYTALPRNPGEA